MNRFNYQCSSLLPEMLRSNVPGSITGPVFTQVQFMDQDFPFSSATPAKLLPIKSFPTGQNYAGISPVSISKRGERRW